jgi:hypothetical protein
LKLASRYGSVPGMARTLRIEDPGAVYQGMNRGDRGDAMVRAAHDYECFLPTLAEGGEQAPWQVPAARRKGDPATVKLAAEVRARTTMSLAWIAKRSSLGIGPHCLP